MDQPTAPQWGEDELTKAEEARYAESDDITECYVCGLMNGMGNLAAKRIRDFDQDMTQFFHKQCWVEFVTIKKWKNEPYEPEDKQAADASGKGES